MQINGKIIGLLLGLLFGGPIGLVIGLFLGHLYDTGSFDTLLRRFGFNLPKRGTHKASEVQKNLF